MNMNPLSSHLGSDVARPCHPSDPEACGACRKVAELDRKIKEMREAIMTMERERLELMLQVNSKHDTLTRRMPLEIIAEIFKLYLPSDLQGDAHRLLIFRTQSRYSLAAPLILSAVSRRWRNIAFSTPSLWATVPLYLTARNVDSLTLLAQEWIDRSGTYPLSIGIKTSLEQTQDLIKMLNQYSSRWRDLYFTAPSGGLSHFASDIEGISQLQTLVLAPIASEGAGVFDLKNFVVRPKSLVMITIRLKDVKIDWNRLTTLQIVNGLCSAECLEVFRRAPRLKTCWLEPACGHSIPSQVPLPQVPIVHPALSHFTIMGPHGHKVLIHLRCPSLRILAIRNFTAHTWMNTVVQFTRQSECIVTNLSLEQVKLTEHDIQSLSCGLPSLQHLHIMPSVPLPSKYLFSHLITVGDRGPRYLPMLRKLTIEQNDTLVDWIFFPLLCRMRNIQQYSLYPLCIHIVLHREFNDPNLVFGEDAAKGQSMREDLLSLKAQGVKLMIQVGKDKKDVV